MGKGCEGLYINTGLVRGGDSWLVGVVGQLTCTPIAGVRIQIFLKEVEW